MTERARNPIDKHIGCKLQVARAMAGLSTHELAQALEVANDQVVRWEAGDRLGASDLFAVAKLLNQPLAFFFYGLTDTLTQ